jgi:hypothetical protein
MARRRARPPASSDAELNRARRAAQSTRAPCNTEFFSGVPSVCSERKNRAGPGLDALSGVIDDQPMMRTTGAFALLAFTCAACSSGGMNMPTNSDATNSGGAGDMPAKSSTGDAPPVDPLNPPATVSPLPRSTPEAEGISSAGVLTLVNALATQINEVHSLMLLRHGKVVAEAGGRRTRPATCTTCTR